MEEFELKARLDEPQAFRDRLREAGWEAGFRGRMRDRRYDTPDRELKARGEGLRVRRYLRAEGAERDGGVDGGRAERDGDGGDAGAEAGGDAEMAYLTWKGPARREKGFKRREELEVRVEDGATAEELLARLGYPRLTMAIDRRVEVYRKGGVTIRIEEYPHMDVLAEIEGEPAPVEERIPELGLPREAWRPWSLDEFFRDFERRTGMEARLSWAEEEGWSRPGGEG